MASTSGTTPPRLELRNQNKCYSKCFTYNYGSLLTIITINGEQLKLVWRPSAQVFCQADLLINIARFHIAAVVAPFGWSTAVDAYA